MRNRSVFAKVKARSSEVLVRYGFLFERLGVPSKKYANSPSRRKGFLLCKCFLGGGQGGMTLSFTTVLSTKISALDLIRVCSQAERVLN